MGSMVKEHVGVIILAVFILVAVFGPITCILLSRRREHKKFHPSPQAFRQARTKLGTVAECKKDTEKGLGGDAEWTDNCPICIGPLCPVAHDEAGRDAVVETKGGPTEPHEPGASGSNDAAEGHEGGVRNSTASNAPVNPTDGGGEDETPTSRVAQISRRLSMRKHRVSTERDMEILKLKSCGHWFHARCLSSWFLIDRYDCPVCRKNYWHGRARRVGPMQAFLRNDYAPSPTAARMGLGAMV